MTKKERSTFRDRLADRTRLPRRSWYPIIPVAEYEEGEWQKQFDVVCGTIRRTMFTILGYTGFCLIALGQPDAMILKRSAIKLPVINSDVSPAAFMLLGPVVLVIITAYLHIFVGRWLRMKSVTTAGKLSPPYLFNLTSQTATVLTSFIFYWLPPIVLIAFVYKGTPFIGNAALNWLIALFSIIALALLSIRRCPIKERKFHNLFPWFFLLTALSVLLFTIEIFKDNDLYSRVLNLERADLEDMKLRRAQLKGAILEEAYLMNVDLREAYLTDANLIRANLTDANLTHAYLTNANLTDANLTDANLTNADLIDADLGGANLTNANLTYASLTRAKLMYAKLNHANLTKTNLITAHLRGANLTYANLRGANLTDANLADANLTDANLTDANLTHANLTGVIWSNTICPDGRYADPKGLNACAALP